MHSCRLLRKSVPGLFLSLTAVFSLVGCGDTVTDPADVTVFKLKTPMALSAIPQQGKITLTWFGNNNEKDFSGYNIYVSSASRDEISKAFALKKDDLDPHLYSPITFKTANDDKIANVRSNLSKLFNWDEASKGNKEGDGKNFSPFLRCNVAANDAGGACVKATKANENFRANGQISFTFPENSLQDGKEYAFFVTSTQDDGEEIASPTTGVMFVRPRKVFVSPEFAITTVGKTRAGLSLPAGSEPVIAGGKYEDSDTYFCLPVENSDPDKKTNVYFGTSGTQLVPAIVGANGTRIADLGPALSASNGVLSDAPLLSPLRSPSQVLLPFAESKPNAAPTVEELGSDVGSEGGYSRCGQSVTLKDNHVYSIAIPGVTEWRYALLSVAAGFNASPVSGRSGFLSFVSATQENERRL